MLLAVACADPAPRAEVIDGCTLGPIETAIAPARGSLAIAEPSTIAIVDRGAVKLRPRGGRIRSFTLEGAEAIYAFERAGDQHVLIAYGACDGAPCLIAQLLDRAGAAIGEAVRTPFSTGVRSSKVASDDRGVYLAWSERGARSLERWQIAGRSLIHETHALGTEAADDEAPVEILGAAAHEGSWAVVWRRGPPEAHESEMFVTTGAGHASIEALHHAVAIESLSIEGGTVRAIASFEYSRPHVVRVRGSEVVDAREIAPDEGGAARARLDRDEGGLWLRRVSAAGDPIGAPIRVARGELGGARITGTNGRYHVAWIAERAVRSRAVRCEATPNRSP
jgi:hypothetical protein